MSRGSGGSARGACRLAVLAGLVLTSAGLLARPAALRAQQSTEPPAWIGVGLSARPACDGVSGTAAGAAPSAVVASGCRTAYVAETVIVGGPADSAGLVPGDTLISVQGHALGTPAGEEALAHLRAGQRVGVLVGRAGGRRTLQVVPRERPGQTMAVRLRVAGAGPDGSGVVRVQLAPRFGPADPARAMARPTVTPIGPGREGGSEYVVPLAPPAVRGESATVLRFDIHGTPTTWTRRGGTPMDTLSPRLLAIRDSVLREARARLDSLRTVYRSQLRSALQRSEAFQSTSGTVRLAGAEFRPLDPDLASYFQGADAGLLVLRVLPGTPAGMLGLRAGDVVVRAAGDPVRDALDLRSALAKVAPDDSVDVVWIRKGKSMRGVLRGP